MRAHNIKQFTLIAISILVQTATWIRQGGNFGFNTSPNYGILNTPSPTNIPGARFDPAVWFDASTNTGWMFGGKGVASDNNNAQLNDLWKFNISSGWIWVGGTTLGNNIGNYSGSSLLPRARDSAKAFLDTNRKVWIFGGVAAVGALTDLWTYNLNSGVWTLVNGSNAVDVQPRYSTPVNPGSRYDYGAWMDTNNVLWIFGGKFSGTDVWAFNGTWRFISGPNTQNFAGNSSFPAARHSPACWGNSMNKLYLFGGSTRTSFLNDLWIFNGTHWAIISTSGSISARCCSTAWYNPQTNVAYLFGGSGGTFSNPTSRGDFFQFTVSNATWQSLTSTSSNCNNTVHPCARNSAGGWYAISSNSIWLFVGEAQSTSFLSDFWIYSTTSLTTSLLTTAQHTTNSFTTSPLTSMSISTSHITSAAITSAQLTTQGLTSSPITSASLTTSPITSGDITSAQITSAELTTSPITSGEVTTYPITSEESTTSPITSGDITSAEVTTSPVTSSELTTSPITSSEVTSAPLTSEEVTSSPITSGELTSSPITSGELTTEEATSSPITTYYLTTNEITSNSVTTEAPVVTTSSLTLVPIIFNDVTVAQYDGEYKIINNNTFSKDATEALSDTCSLSNCSYVSISNGAPFNGTFTISYQELANVHSWSLEVRFRGNPMYNWNFVLLGKNESRSFFNSQPPPTWTIVNTGGYGADSLSGFTQNSLVTLQISSAEPASADIDSIALVVFTEPPSNESSSPNSWIQDNLIPLSVGLAVAAVVISSTIVGAILIRNRKKRGSHEELELDSPLIVKEAVVLSSIGSGNFGVVYKGTAFGGTDVALKLMKAEEHEILAEASILTKVHHPNCVRFFGIFREDKNLYLVTEYCSQGSLLDLIVKKTFRNSDLLSKAIDAAKGMVYLEEMNIIHCDLAARNLLVSAAGEVKVADFGMSKFLEDKLYDRVDGVAIPIRWAAPEVIEFRKFSIKSDCWSMGIVLYEIFTHGQIPYPDLPTPQVITSLVERKYRMAQPLSCPTEIWEICTRCFAQEPNARPSMKEICSSLQKLTSISLVSASTPADIKVGSAEYT